MYTYRIEEIRGMYRNGDYSVKREYEKTRIYANNHVLDEEKSVRWNREEVVRLNEEARNKLAAYKLEAAKLNEKLTKDVVTYIMGGYNLKEDVAIVIERTAYDEYHSSMEEYFDKVDDIADFAVKILKANN